MELAIIYAAVFVAGLIVFDQLIRIAGGNMQRSRVLNYRLKLLEKSDNNLDVYKTMLRERGLDFWTAGIGPFELARRYFAQSGLRIDVTRIVLYGAGIALFSGVATGLLIENYFLRLLAVIFILVTVPFFVVWRARNRRIKKFGEQLPNALDVIGRSLLAGHPLPTALSMVSRELADPVGTEFGILSDELTYGTNLDQAMANMIERVGSEDLKLLAVSMSVQRGTGGNYVEIVENLAGVIRDRSIVRAKIKSLSAEGRITALFMTIYPFLLYIFITFMQPKYFDPIWQSGHAGTIISIAFIAMAIGDYILYRLVTFDF